MGERQRNSRQIKSEERECFGVFGLYFYCWRPVFFVV